MRERLTQTLGTSRGGLTKSANQFSMSELNEVYASDLMGTDGKLCMIKMRPHHRRRNVMPIANPDESELKFGLELVASEADALEETLGGDRF